jgi:hypothetical protein
MHAVSTSGMRRRSVVVLAAFMSPLAATMGQQPGVGATPISALRASDVTAGSPAERTLLSLGLLEPLPVNATLRPMERAWIERTTRAIRGDTVPITQLRLRFAISDPLATVWLNSAPRSDQDGAVWQGRGLTAALSAGVQVRAPWVSLALRPVAFWAQNLVFEPFVAAPSGDFRNTQTAFAIDLPFRFGASSYARLDGGESWIRVGPSRAGVGFTTASQQWGPAHFYPLLMGTEAGGYPRVFVETRDVPLWIGRASVQWTVGRLEASHVSRGQPGERSRIASAAVGSFSPKGFPGVELGAGRFYHKRWPKLAAVRRHDALLPLEDLYSGGSPYDEGGSSNQLASVFASVAPPGSGVQVYGEYLREDHSIDARDLTVEPDHSGAYTVGMRGVWRRAGGANVFTIESTDGRYTHLHRVREQSAPYVHTSIVEGHT